MRLTSRNLQTPARKNLKSATSFDEAGKITGFIFRRWFVLVQTDGAYLSGGSSFGG
jgi:hypothetical protein